MTTIADVWLSSSIDPWRRLGFSDYPIAQPDGSVVPCIPIAGLGFRFLPHIVEPSASGSCATGWTVRSDDATTNSVDGVATRVIAELQPAPKSGAEGLKPKGRAMDVEIVP